MKAQAWEVLCQLNHWNIHTFIRLIEFQLWALFLHLCIYIDRLFVDMCDNCTFQVIQLNIFEAVAWPSYIVMFSWYKAAEQTNVTYSHTRSSSLSPSLLHNCWRSHDPWKNGNQFCSVDPRGQRKREMEIVKNARPEKKNEKKMKERKTTNHQAGICGLVSGIRIVRICWEQFVGLCFVVWGSRDARNGSEGRDEKDVNRTWQGIM